MNGFRVLPDSWYDPPDWEPEIPDDLIDAEIDEYTSDPLALADMACDVYDVTLSICSFLLEKCENGRDIAEQAIRNSPAAMLRIEESTK
jgi:hypothetical protein